MLEEHTRKTFNSLIDILFSRGVLGAFLGLFFQAAIKPQEKTALMKDKCTITDILKEI